VILTLVSGVFSGVGHSLQRKSTDQMPELTPRVFYQQHLGLLKVILSTPLWWLSGILAVIGALLRWQAFAFADISLVKPLVNINILVVLALCVGLWKEKIGKWEFTGIVSLLTGIIFLSVFAEDRLVYSFNVAFFLLSALGCFLIVGGFLYLGSKKERRSRDKELFFALSAGVLYGIASVFLKAMTVEVWQILGYFQIFDFSVIITLFTRWTFWGYAICSIAAYFLLMCAYSRRRASIAIPINNSLSTVIPILLAIPIFGDAVLLPLEGHIVFPYSFIRLFGILTVLIGVFLLRRFQYPRSLPKKSSLDVDSVSETKAG
jgi:hypothetical protein